MRPHLLLFLFFSAAAVAAPASRNDELNDFLGSANSGPQAGASPSTTTDSAASKTTSKEVDSQSATGSSTGDQEDDNSIKKGEDSNSQDNKDDKGEKNDGDNSPSSNSTDTPLPTQLPRPFDSSVGSNFTASSCPDLIRAISTDPAVISCVPVSLLLQTSRDFFEITKSRIGLTWLLDQSCAVDGAECAALFADYAARLTGGAGGQGDSGGCAADLKLGNPVAVQAQNGLLSYQTLFQAACLVDTADADQPSGSSSDDGSTGNYCFLKAVTNRQTAADVYPYHLPLGLSLPAGARQSCSACTRRTMQVFAAAAQDGSQPVSRTYNGAAKTVNLACGPGFVQEVLVEGAASPGRGPGTALALAMAVAAVLVLA